MKYLTRVLGITPLALLAAAVWADAPAPAAATLPTTTLPAAAAPAAADLEATRQQLLTLRQMLADQLITQQEYDQARAKILSNMMPPASTRPATAPATAPATLPAKPQEPALLPTFAGRWSVTATPANNPVGQVFTAVAPSETWVVAVKGATVSIGLEKLVRSGRHNAAVPTTELVALNVGSVKLVDKTLSFTITETSAAVHARGSAGAGTTTLTSYQIQLGTSDKLGGTYSKDGEIAGPLGVIKTHEAGTITLAKIPT